MNRQVEILAPAGSYESLKAAVCAGADAVYVGGSRFGARAYAKNLAEEELLTAIDYVHIHGRRIYLTVNTLLKDQEIEHLYEYLLPYYLRGLDGIIVQDIGVIEYVRIHFPDLAIHASTQMTVTGAKGAAFFKSQGITRVVPARELSLEEIRRMKQETGLEIECFVHGAMCYCYSGQCLLSSMIGGRSGNRGQCAQPCRLPYGVDGKKPADLMSLKDLCTIEMIPGLLKAGIDSFKIEGRMKQPDYVYTVVSLYRKYTDLCLKEGDVDYKVAKSDKEKLLGAYQRRGYTEGYYKQKNGRNMISFERPSQIAEENRECPDYKIQEKINGYLILFPGERAKLILEYNSCRAECEGEIVQPAMRQPLLADRVERQMRKTGNTEYCFDQFRVETEGEVFLPMQALNELRREGIRRLTECILSRYVRQLPEQTGADGRAFAGRSDLRECKKTADRVMLYEDRSRSQENGSQKIRAAGNGKRPCLSCLVLSVEQLEEALECEYIEVIYMDSEEGLKKETVRILRRHREENQKGRKQFCLAMPYIFRDEEAKIWERVYTEIEDLYDGVLLRNWESFWWLKGHGYTKIICFDHNLYVFNRYGKTFIKRQGITKYTVPMEQNARELAQMDVRGAVMNVYGYQPVMVTANCIRKTCDRCQKEEGYLYIRDRRQKRFAVRTCCPYCYNVIYNSAPLFLADKTEEIRRLFLGELRLDFSIETREEMRRIIKMYTDAFVHGRDVRPPETEYTRGHFKRGVK